MSDEQALRKEQEALKEWAEEDWSDALRLAQLWGQYWDGDAITRLDLAQAGFLARSFLAALGQLHAATVRLEQRNLRVS